MTTTSPSCFLQGGSLTCPLDGGFSFGDQVLSIFGDLVCPLDAVAQFGVVDASQEGLCECTLFAGPFGTPEDEAVKIDCACFACDDASALNFGYVCDESASPIIGSCLSLDCNGNCNTDELFEQPMVMWKSASDGAIGQGNGVFLTPDGMQLIATASDGTVTSLDPFTGAFLWMYNPPNSGGSTITCHSNMVFTTEFAPNPYMIYSIIDNEITAGAATRVIALDMNGSELWISSNLPGVAAGSPVISSSGDYVFLTHNSGQSTIGHFSVVSAASGGSLFYSEFNTTNPFSPPGIFHNPEVGYYDGDLGVGNTNDIIVWSVAVRPDAVIIGDGANFAFQFPLSFDGTSNGVSYFLLGENRPFQSNTAPVLTNFGRSMYISASRSSFFGWIGVEGLARFHFNRDPREFAGFTRNDVFPGQAVFASVALSSDPVEPFLFGGSAAREFVKLSHDFVEQTVIPTSSLILAEAVVDPMDRVVYFAEENGDVHQVGFDSFIINWDFSSGLGIEGEMALRSDGSILYYADTDGTVTALLVANVPQTDSPSSAPSVSPSTSPSTAPSTSPTAAPPPTTPLPTFEGFVAPSGSPTAEPSPSPSSTPSDLPSASPSQQPSTAPSTVPSSVPSVSPSSAPSTSPSTAPSTSPSTVPSFIPSDYPSGMPSASLSTSPSGSPSTKPSSKPTQHPSESPSNTPPTPAADPAFSFVVSDIEEDQDWCLTATRNRPNANMGFRPCNYDTAPKSQQWKYINNQFVSGIDDSLCVQVGFGLSAFNGVRIRLGPCSNPLTMFLYDERTRMIRSMAYPNLCLSNRGSNPNSGDTMHAYSCVDRPDFYWNIVEI